MKYKEIVEKMTLEEKAAFLSGKTEWETRDYPHLNIPSIFCADGPNGLRRQAGKGDHLGLNPSVPATCFPTTASIANSWNEQLGEQLGEALGQEAAAQGVHVLLGPGLNIKRSPLCGRNFEYFSEDPYLSGKMAAAYVRGIQKNGVCACPKHLAVNNQELRRMAMDSVLDERTLREIYLTGFEIAVKEGNARAIMSSYNEINGTYANENRHLLEDILRKDWGFEGIVITDWGGSNDHVRGVEAGSDLEMPASGFDSARQLIQAVEEKRLSEKAVDACVDRLLSVVLDTSKAVNHQKKNYFETEHHKLAGRAASESAVLLKNEDHILPLKAGAKVAVIGDFAFLPRYQGAGSSLVNPLFVETIAQKISEYELEAAGFARGYQRDGQDSGILASEAIDLACKADIVLYFFGLDEMSELEGKDRLHMKIPQNQIDLLEDLAGVNPRLVGVLSAGACVEMPWIGCCKALLHGYLNGQAGAGAVLDLLTGKVNPSGHLNETYPMSYEDTPAFENFPGKERTTEYREGLYVGYRYYNTVKKEVRFPFGFGLSYTEFSYENLRVKKDGIHFTLKNTGAMDGAEVCQMYVRLPNAFVYRPNKELKGFCKVFLKAGESREAAIPFDDKTFRYWNVKTGKWEIEEGTYTICVGSNCEDIRLTGEIFVQGTSREYPYRRQELPSYYSGNIQKVTEKEFERLLGHAIPSGRWGKDLGLNDAVCQMYYAKSRLARFIYRRLDHMKKKSEQRGKPDLNIMFIYNIPFRGIAKMTGGMVSMEMAGGVVDVVNGHFGKGVRKIVGGFFRNRKKNRQYERRLAQCQRKGIKQ